MDSLTPIRILFMRDSAKETQRIVDELRRGHFDPTYSLVDTIPGAQSALDAGRWDLVIGDVSLEHGAGLDVLARMQKQEMDLPFIVITKSADEKIAYRALTAGASDFLTFDQLGRLNPIVKRELRQTAIRRQCRKAEPVTVDREDSEHLAIANAADTVGAASMKQSINGIAHDFNNQLAVILTAAAFVHESMDPANPLRQEIEQIVNAGRQANELNQQLLLLGLAEDKRSPGNRFDELHAARVSSYQKNCVLVVEDDESVRKLVCRILLANGYEVLSAQNSNEALAMCQRTDKPINLLLTDVIMPGLSGKVLADQLMQNYPGIKVLFMSGYTDEATSWQNNMAPNTSFLKKPFGNFELLNCVREILEKEAVGSQNPNATDVTSTRG